MDIITLVELSNIHKGTPMDFNDKSEISVFLPLPTKLADGLRLEGVSLLSEISPKNWFLRSKSSTEKFE